MDEWVVGWTGWSMDECMDGWMDGWMDEWMNGFSYAVTNSTLIGIYEVDFMDIKVQVDTWMSSVAFSI